MENEQLLQKGMKVADSRMFQEDKIWSRYSNDKVDIGETLGQVIRTLHKVLPLDQPLAALSIGSSNEPQFRILETAFRRGLYLVDIEHEALEVVRERVARQLTNQVRTFAGDYRRIFHSEESAAEFVRSRLCGARVELITLHHSLYYTAAEKWLPLVESLMHQALAEVGAIHAVMMAPDCTEFGTTGWLYEHFAARFCGHHNNQDLRELAKSLEERKAEEGTQILLKQSRVRFLADNFEKLMSVVWMILLYPDVHSYTDDQRREITEFVLHEFWLKKSALWQIQDHLVIYRGVPFPGLI